jgi:hypothetical protein
LIHAWTRQLKENVGGGGGNVQPSENKNKIPKGNSCVCACRKKTKAATADRDEDPDLISLVLFPVVAGFNRAFSSSTGVAQKIFSMLSIENIKDGLKCQLYDKYTAFLSQDAVVSNLRDLGSKSAHKMLAELSVRGI